MLGSAPNLNQWRSCECCKGAKWVFAGYYLYGMPVITVCIACAGTGGHFVRQTVLMHVKKIDPETAFSVN